MFIVYRALVLCHNNSILNEVFRIWIVLLISGQLIIVVILFIMYFQMESTIRNLKLSGHVGFDSLPDQLVNKSVQNGFVFNILCIGKYYNLI